MRALASGLRNQLARTVVQAAVPARLVELDAVNTNAACAASPAIRPARPKVLLRTVVVSLLTPRQHPRRAPERKENHPMSGEPYPERNEPRVAEADPAATKAATVALVWTLAFIALHVYWFMGGRVGFGDQTDPLPGWPSSVGGWIFSVVVDGMWIAGLVVPSALAWPWGRRLPHRLLVRLMWVGAIVLLARGGAGFVDDALRFSGLYG